MRLPSDGDICKKKNQVPRLSEIFKIMHGLVHGSWFALSLSKQVNIKTCTKNGEQLKVLRIRKVMGSWGELCLEGKGEKKKMLLSWLMRNDI